MIKDNIVEWGSTDGGLLLFHQRKTVTVGTGLSQVY